MLPQRKIIPQRTIIRSIYPEYSMMDLYSEPPYLALVVIVIAFLSFIIGMFCGCKKAACSHQWKIWRENLTASDEDDDSVFEKYGMY